MWVGVTWKSWIVVGNIPKRAVCFTIFHRKSTRSRQSLESPKTSPESRRKIPLSLPPTPITQRMQILHQHNAHANRQQLGNCA